MSTTRPSSPRARRALLMAPMAPMAVLLLAGLAGSCKRPAPEPLAIRLVDLFERQKVAAPRPVPPPAAPMSACWQAGPGVADLAVRDGRLAGRSTTDFPVLHCERTAGLDLDDVLHSVEIRLRASAGANLSVQIARPGPLDLAQAVEAGRGFPWRITTPIVAGPEAHTYVLSAASNPFPISAAMAGHILVRPTDAVGATFEVESVRLIFEKDFLAGIPSGVSWQGLGEIYRESLVTHAPEEVRLSLDVPHGAWLDLAVGTLESGPVSFRVEAREGDGPPRSLLDHAVQKPHQWEAAPVDLAAYGGKRVTLSLSLKAGRPGALGLWGAPVVRRRLTAEASAPPAERRPRGVILILTDTLRRDHLEVYGYGRPTAPNLARLARGGAVFRDCQAESTWTKVAAPSILTSLYPPTHGVKDFEDRLPSSAVTLAEAYRGAGFATLSLSSVIFTGRFSNLHQGFEELHESTSLASRKSSKTAHELVDRLIPWLEQHRDAPFFVFLHVTDPHDPYEPAAPYNGLWVDAARKAEHERRQQQVQPHIADPLLQAYAMPSRDEVAAAGLDPDAYISVDRDWYDGAIRGMDDAIGKLDGALRRLGLDRDVVVATVADHGEEFFDHGHMFHGQTVYGELTGVPLIFWGAGVKPGTSVGETVQTIDVMPTLLALAGVPVPREAQGHSLAAALAGRKEDGERRARPAFSIKAATRDIFGPPPRDTESLAIVADGWKLVHNAKRPPGKPEYELFDHRQDPLDQHDLAAQHPDVVQRLAGPLDGWWRRVSAQRLPPDSAAAKKLSSEELERLRSLGYIR